MAETTVEKQQSKKSSTTRKFFLLFVLPAACLLLAGFAYLKGGRYITTENAYVKADIIHISADIDGRVLSVAVDDNQVVKQGEVLFLLDVSDVELQLAEADAELRLIANQVEILRADYNEARSNVAEAQDRIGFLRRKVQRQASIKNQGIGSAQAYDDALFELNAALQRVKVQQQAANRALVELMGDSDLPVTDHPSYQMAQVRREQLQAEIKRAQVTAPIDGIISNLTLQKGEYVRTGQPVFSLINTTDVWIEANLKETQLTHVRQGQPASIKIDAYPGEEWTATVAAIASATGAEFAMLPPQNATGNWVKVVQRVPVLFDISVVDETPVLRAGMTATVTIDSGHQRSLSDLLPR